MDYTQSDAHVFHLATGNRMHQSSEPVPTEVSAADMNMVIWSLMEVLKDAGIDGAPFDRDDPASYRRFLGSLNTLFLPSSDLRVFSQTANIQAAVKAKSYRVGQKIITNLYGGSLWIVKADVVLQDPGESTINYDDELHLVVPLVGGGTAIAECQLASVTEFARQRCNQSYTQLFARLRQSGQGVTVLGAAYGDSTVFGQYDGFPGAIGTSGTATGFGDSSVYAHDQHPNPWPSVLQASLREVYGNTVSVINRGYSGDRVGSGYNRHRVGAGDLFSFVCYGINDVLYATANGTTPSGLFNESGSYALSKFVPALRKFCVRQMLRGSVPILVAPYAFSSLVGYDSTNYAAAKMLDYYRNAIFSVGQELGLLVVDQNDIIGNVTLNFLVDGVHPATIGHSLIGRRMAAPLVGRGFKNPEIVLGDRRLTASILTDSVDGKGSNEIINTPDVQTFGKPFYDLSTGQALVVTSSGVFWSFYLAEDAKAVMPIGYLSANSSLTFSIDFETASGQSERLRVDSLGVKGVFRTLPSTKTVTSTSVRDLNHPAVLAEPIVITGKGWHTLRLSAGSGSFVASGVYFWTDLSFWNSLPLAGSMSQSGDMEPAWTVRDGLLLLRGIVKSPTPGVRLKMFDLPAVVAGLMPANLPTTPVALPWSRVTVSLDTGAIYWEANVGHATDTLNLECIRIPLGALPGP